MASDRILQSTGLAWSPTDPAQVQDLSDVVEAFRRIADVQAPLIVNGIEEFKYLTEILRNAAGSPEKGDWYRDQGLQGEDAVVEAAQQGGYVLWRLTPFLRTQQDNQVECNLWC